MSSARAFGYRCRKAAAAGSLAAKSSQLLAFTALADTVILGSRIRAVCHQPDGTNSISPGRSTHRPGTARANNGNRVRSGWSRSSIDDLFASMPGRGYSHGVWPEIHHVFLRAEQLHQERVRVHVVKVQLGNELRAADVQLQRCQRRPLRKQRAAPASSAEPGPAVAGCPPAAPVPNPQSPRCASTEPAPPRSIARSNREGRTACAEPRRQ